MAVCLLDGQIEILSLKSVSGVSAVKRIKTFNVGTGFDFQCHSVAKWNSEKLIVSGERNKDATFFWCCVSFENESVDPSQDICTVNGRGWTHTAVSHNNLYISCWTEDDITNGMYAFNVLNPQKPKFLYQHPELKRPGSIIADRNYVFVCDFNSNTIHQVTHIGELVTIHPMPQGIYGIFYDDQHCALYTTSTWSNNITVYKLEYPSHIGIPLEILQMDDKSIQIFEEALKDGKETVYSIQIMVVGHIDVGKTTLVKRLLGEQVKISERCSTEGVDVYVDCCDVSLSTHEWIRRSTDSEHDYKLQRLVKILKENYHAKTGLVDLELDASSNQMEGYAVDNYMTIDVQQTKMGQDVSSTSRLQRESSSILVNSSLTQLETNSVPELSCKDTENDKIDPLREMLKLLQQNPDKAKQDVAKYAHLTMLDFAGQYAFYTTHQMFLKSRAIYLLVTDSSKDTSDLVADDSYFDSQGKHKCVARELVDIWMNSIHSCAPPVTEGETSANSQASSHTITPPPVLLVGTHIDQIPQNRYYSAPKVRRLDPSLQEVREYCRMQGQKYLKKIRKFLKDKPTKVHLVDGDFAIDNTVVDSELEKLKEKIVEVASQLPYWGKQIPTRWFLLEQQLMKLKDAGLKVISRINVENLNKEGNVQIKKSDELELFLRYLHDNGTIIYFSIEPLRDNVVLDPKWLIDALKSLINAQPNLPTNPADQDTESNRSDIMAAPNDLTQKWKDFKEKGILTLDIVDAIWTKEIHPELLAYKTHILMLMEQFNIIAKPRSFNELGEKFQVEDYFLTPCMLRQESPAYVISPEQEPLRITTPELHFKFKGKYLPEPIFHRLLAACITCWPVAKKESENLIFCGCCVFDLDLFHRLTVYLKVHIICVKITRLVIDEIKTNETKTPNANLCSKVRRFITFNLDNITSYLGQNLKYTLETEHQTWLADEGHDSDGPITREHMNHSRLRIALVTVCGNAMREVLRTNVPAPFTDINQAILANKSSLTSNQRRALLNKNQSQLVFPDPQGSVGNLDQFDPSLLYILIRNITSVPAPSTGWGNDPQDQPRDQSLGANIERIRSYRNNIVGHSMDEKINQQEFDDYWKKIEYVIDDIGQVLGKQEYKKQLEILKKQVISVFEAC